jgi:hypothetical protein
MTYIGLSIMLTDQTAELRHFKFAFKINQRWYNQA